MFFPDAGGDSTTGKDEAFSWTAHCVCPLVAYRIPPSCGVDGEGAPRVSTRFGFCFCVPWATRWQRTAVYWVAVMFFGLPRLGPSICLQLPSNLAGRAHLSCVWFWWDLLSRFSSSVFVDLGESAFSPALLLGSVVKGVPADQLGSPHAAAVLFLSEKGDQSHPWARGRQQGDLTHPAYCLVVVPVFCCPSSVLFCLRLHGGTRSFARAPEPLLGEAGL